jgi:phosphohistidine phosphatase
MKNVLNNQAQPLREPKRTLVEMGFKAAPMTRHILETSWPVTMVTFPSQVSPMLANFFPEQDTTMDFILWRHADAQDGEPDWDRPLTTKGRKQAERMALWLKAHQPKGTRILVSPTLRTRETADALECKYEIDRNLAPGVDAVHLLAAAGWPDATGAVLLIGHQPTLGEAASLLLFGEGRPLSLKKGAVLWLTNRVRGDAPQTVIKAAMTAEML